MPRSKVSKTASKERRKNTTEPAAESAENSAGGTAAEPPPSHPGLSPPAPAPGAQTAETNGANAAGAHGGPITGTLADNSKAHAAEIAEKVKELVRLAQEQGYLTYGDINDA